MHTSRVFRLVAIGTGLLVVPASLFLAIGSTDPCDYETDPECEDPERGHISGTVIVPGASGQANAASLDERVGRALAHAAAMASADPEFRAEREVLDRRRRTDAARRIGGEGAKAKRPAFMRRGSGHDEPRPGLATPRGEAWKAGEVIVRTEAPLRPRKADWEAALAPHLPSGQTLTFGLCNTDTMCLAHVVDEDGKPLNLDKTKDAALLLDEASGVRYATVNRLSYALASPNDDFYAYQWHYSAMNLEAAWDITTGSDQVTVAVIDTGLLTGHPDLAGRYAGGADLISDTSISNDGDARDNNPLDPGDNVCGAGCHSFHGSHVAGTIGAVTNNGSLVAGVSWAGRILAARVLGQGSAGSNFDIVAGVFWAIGEDVDGVNRNSTTADVINLSLGGVGNDPANDEAIAAAIASGAIVLVAAGNTNENAANYTPANSPGAIVVAALGHGGGGQPYRAPYSNYGNLIAVSAPGGDLTADNDGDGYPDGVLSTKGADADFLEGTSMATPHVAGLAVLMKSIDVGLFQADARALLEQNANGNIDCPSGCGAGLVDAARTLLALEGRANEPLVAVSPSTLRLAKGERQGDVVLRNVGGAATDVSVSVTGPNRDRVSTQTGDRGSLAAGGELTLGITVDRGDTDVGEANLVIGWGQNQTTQARLVWTAEEVVIVDLVGVFALRFPEDPAADIEVERGVPALREDGFAYKLFNLTPGAYVVAGVADENNDGELDATVEGIGVYPTVNAPVELVAEAGINLTGVDFVVAPAFEGDEVNEGNESSPVGGACQQNTDCQPGLFCDPSLTGGYCTADCSVTACPGDGVCFTFCADENCVDAFSLCLDGCTANSDCREAEGYICDADSTCFPG